MVEMAPFVAAYSDDGVGLNDESLMEKAMRTAAGLDKIIAAHCEDMELRDGGYIHAGSYAREHGHKGICSEANGGRLKEICACGKDGLRLSRPVTSLPGKACS